MKPETKLLFCRVAFLLICVMFVSTSDKRSSESQASLYCAMVEEYKISNGQYGWPAYKGEGQCL